MVTVSVLMPVFNGERYLAAALESILRQTFRDFELIVIDDGSTDGSLRILEDYRARDPRIRVISRENRGIAKTFNELIGYAQGEYVAGNGQDDIYPPERLAFQVAWLRANPEHAALCGAFSTIDSSGRVVANLPCGAEAIEITDELRNGVVRTHLSTYAFRTELLVRVGGFREYFESAEDVDLQLRVGEAGRIGYVPENFYFWRLHGSSLTHRFSSVLVDFYHQKAFDFQKQRQATGLDDLQRGCPPAKPNGASPAHSALAEIQGHLLGQAWRDHLAGRKAKALGTGLRALTANPADIDLWKSVIALALKRSRP
jgi:glycosyltransferase involved in cell wall biosynthesis